MCSNSFEMLVALEPRGNGAVADRQDLRGEDGSVRREKGMH
jgi:hypothetical protein